MEKKEITSHLGALMVRRERIRELVEDKKCATPALQNELEQLTGQIRTLKRLLLDINIEEEKRFMVEKRN